MMLSEVISEDCLWISLLQKRGHSQQDSARNRASLKWGTYIANRCKTLSSWLAMCLTSIENSIGRATQDEVYTGKLQVTQLSV